MTRRTRETLKNHFSDGQRPTQEEFSDLIDSMLNMTDEGFSKSVKYGEEVYAAVGHDTLISFYRDGIDQSSPQWQVKLRAGSQLEFKGESDGRLPKPGVPGDVNETGSLLYLDKRQRVGIGIDNPQVELDVAGTIRSTGRRGAYQGANAKDLAANGQWQKLVEGLHGCQAFEITAGAGKRATGHFSLMHAVALNTYNPTLGWLDFLNRKRGIRCTHAYYGRRCDRIGLRWIGQSGHNGKYDLEIKTGCNFGTDVKIQAHITQLWFDPDMSQEG